MVDRARGQMLRRRIKHDQLDYDPLRITMRFADGTSFKYVLNRLGREVLDFEVESHGNVRRFAEVPQRDCDEWRND